MGFLSGLTKQSSDDSKLDRAKESDLVTLPEKIEGTNCGNCRFVDKVTNPDKPFCQHTKVAQNVTPKMCCRWWDAEGVKRAWLKK